MCQSVQRVPFNNNISNIATLQQGNTVVLYNTHILLKDPFHSYYNRLNCTENKIGYLMLTRTSPKFMLKANNYVIYSYMWSALNIVFSPKTNLQLTIKNNVHIYLVEYSTSYLNSQGYGHSRNIIVFCLKRRLRIKFAACVSCCWRWLIYCFQCHVPRKP